jgi:hypothetical protein
MLKISIVMLTTAGFAGLLIWDPYGPVVASAGRRTTVVAVNVPAATQTQPEQSPVAKPTAQPNSSRVQEAPAVGAAKPDAPTDAVTPMRPQLAVSSPARPDKRDREGAAAHPYLHTASVTNVAHHARRHV